MWLLFASRPVKMQHDYYYFIRIVNGKIVVRPPTIPFVCCRLQSQRDVNRIDKYQFPGLLTATHTQSGVPHSSIWWQAAQEKGFNSAEEGNCRISGNSPCLFKCMIKLFRIPESICSISWGNKMWPTSTTTGPNPSKYGQWSDKVIKIKVSPTRVASLTSRLAS